ncbi:MAG: AIR synthase related protein, partial [Patescibacteria group bacterium]|nr:AIR synthase related protein [Patescibacteria group bacterium]
MRTLLLPFLLVSQPLWAAEANDRQVVVPIRLGNPVTPDAPPQEYKVIATSDEDGTPTGYRLPLQVHVCVDNQCWIVQATMHWNAMGYYDRLECPPDAPLTRKEHDPFTDADYRKLDRILKNRQSILGTLPYEALVVKQPEPAETVDGWSGATPQAVAEAVRNLACVGAEPIGITDCLNFG